MKRSEALELIRRELLGKQIDHDRFDEQILSTVEKIGMKPPQNNPDTVIYDSLKWEAE